MQRLTSFQVLLLSSNELCNVTNSRWASSLVSVVDSVVLTALDTQTDLSAE